MNPQPEKMRTPMTKFVMDYDNIPGQGPLMLFKEYELDGKTWRSLATVEDIQVFEAEIRSLQDDRTDQELKISDLQSALDLERQESERLRKEIDRHTVSYNDIFHKNHALRKENADAVEALNKLKEAILEKSKERSDHPDHCSCVYKKDRENVLLKSEISSLKAEIGSWKERFKAIVGCDSPDSAGNAVISIKAEVERLKEDMLGKTLSPLCMLVTKKDWLDLRAHNEALVGALKKYGRHLIGDEPCDVITHSSIVPCSCGLDKLLASPSNSGEKFILKQAVMDLVLDDVPHQYQQRLLEILK